VNPSLQSTAGTHPVSARISLPPASRREQIVAHLRDEIVTGELPAGTQLKQDELASRFGVSPAPIREALRQLENEGLVEHFPNRGVFVTDISAEDIVNLLLPVRHAIESFALRKAESERSAELLAQLDDIVQGMRDAAADDDFPAINELDVQFHETIVALSGSEQAARLWHSVYSRIKAQIYRSSTRHDTALQVANDHQAIIDALRSHDRASIDAVLHFHIIEQPADQLRSSPRVN
jgi:DNA-binding GntR family transcriptional regulator